MPPRAPLAGLPVAMTFFSAALVSSVPRFSAVRAMVASVIHPAGTMRCGRIIGKRLVIATALQVDATCLPLRCRGDD